MHYFDIIVYGSIQRCDDYLDIVKQIYKKNEVIFLDGEDNLQIYSHLNDYGIMFKREQYNNECLPISFAIPSEKLCTKNNIVKTKILADVVPQLAGHKNLYMFNREDDYYNEYQCSMFGITKKKGGWDCLRHYEIISNKCLPYFDRFKDKPKCIMTNWPSDLQLECNSMLEQKQFDRYNELLKEFFNYCKDNLTTIDLAKYILGKTL